MIELEISEGETDVVVPGRGELDEERCRAAIVERLVHALEPGIRGTVAIPAGVLLDPDPAEGDTAFGLRVHRLVAQHRHVARGIDGVLHRVTEVRAEAPRLGLRRRRLRGAAGRRPAASGDEGEGRERDDAADAAVASIRLHGCFLLPRCDCWLIPCLLPNTGEDFPYRKNFRHETPSHRNLGMT